jgi:aerobic carbon-monoxide dehydrogenase medium subunit
VIPAEFDYVAPDTLDEALSALSQGGEDAKLLAGGHSLLPLMKLRLAAPTLLVDLRKVPDLSGISSNGGVTIGAMTTHTAIADADLGLIAEVSSTIADPQVRNRGTLGGSLAHGDPASDQPAILLAYEGSVTVRGAERSGDEASGRGSGERTIAAADLFQDYLTTAVADDEVMTSVNYPALDGYGFGYQKFNRRKEDWAMVAVSALVKKASDGSCEDVRIGLTHMANVPLRATAAEDALRGGALDAAAIAAASELAAEGTSPPGDLNASPDYKRHLARVLCRRALEEAAA